jgi:hypothetical protein
MEKSAKGLHYFGLDCWMTEFFNLHSLAVIQRTNVVFVVFPAFLENGSAVCAHTNRDQNKQEDYFLYLEAQNCDLFSNIKN